MRKRVVLLAYPALLIKRVLMSREVARVTRYDTGFGTRFGGGGVCKSKVRDGWMVMMMMMRLLGDYRYFSLPFFLGCDMR